MILMALSPHIAEVNRIPSEQRSKAYPKGALILAIQAVSKNVSRSYSLLILSLPFR